MNVIVCFEEDAPRETGRGVLEGLGFSDQPDPHCRWHEPGLLTVHPEHGVDPEILDRLRRLPGVRRIVGVDSDHRLSSWSEGQQESAVEFSNGARIGDGDLSVIAGPCSVESEAQICEIADAVAGAGAMALRGGVFKPRSSPYSFGGLGEEGLEHLALAGERSGLPVVTEALDVEHVDVVARHADMIQIGSRNMQNFPLLFKVGAHPAGKPALLKRGFAATVDEVLMAAEYILLGRIYAGFEGPGVVICERGIRTFDDSLRFTLDVGAIPHLKELTNLPVIADPSHPAGARKYVPPLARAAVAAGADGLLVEVSVAPDRAWCDKNQCLGVGAFQDMMDDVQRLAAIVPRRAS